MFINNTYKLLLLICYIIIICSGQREKEDDCVCVPYYQCEDGKVITTGEGLLDIRVKTCSGIEVCCILSDGNQQGDRETSDRGPDTEPPPPVTDPPLPNGDGGTDGGKPIIGPNLPTVSPGQGCGRRRFAGEGNPIDNSLRITGLLGFPEETFYGEVPWMVRLLPSVNGQINDSYIMCGGSLITPSVVLTAAHCVNSIPTEQIIVRVGDWNVKETFEPIAPQDRKVSRIILHPSFNARNLANDIALLGLQSPVSLTEAVDIICTPDQQNPVNATACFATGWGKNQLNRHSTYQDTLRKVLLPLLGRDECQTKLRKTKLGVYFNLLPGFLCAGGARDSDTCEGDGGGPLYCPLQSDPNRYAVTGIIAWGIDCGKGNPAVFTDVNHYMPWIKEQIAT